MKKGVSPLISTILIILISVIAITLVTNVALPTINRAKENAFINEAGLNIGIIDNTVKEVASEGIGSFRSIQLKVSEGNYRIFNHSENFTGAIEYTFQSKYNTLPLLSIVKEGNIKYSTAVNTRGLVGYWKFDESYGTTANDSSGAGNGGQLLNFPNVSWSSQGKYQTALVFANGTGSGSVGGGLVGIPNSASLNPNREITVVYWIKPENIMTAEILGRGDGGCVASYSSFISSNKPAFRIMNSTDCVELVSDEVLVNNVWYHIVNAYDGSSMKIYVNGALSKNQSMIGALVTNSTPLTIGGANNGAWTFNGTIDNVKIYNRVLSDEEIKTDFDPKQSDYQVVLEYNKIFIEGNERLGKGSHKICIEKIGTYLNRPLVKITRCG